MSPAHLFGLLILAAPGTTPPVTLTAAAAAKAAPKAAVKQLAVAPRAAVAGNTAATAAAAPAVALAAPATAALADEAAAASVSVPSAASAETARPAPPAQAVSPEDWLAQHEPQGSAAQPAPRWPLIVALLFLLAAGGAFVALRARGGGHPLWAKGMPGHAIDILAVKALGQKHRLVLVETSGERLLLSATEHEVRLLSHVASQEGAAIEAAADTTQVAMLTQSMAPKPAAPQAAAAPAAAQAPTQAAHATYAAHATAAAESLPLGQTVPPAPGGSLSAEALYEGAARSMDLDDQDEEADERAALAPDSGHDTIASDVAGLARWRQAAAQGADPWGKQL